MEMRALAEATGSCDSANHDLRRCNCASARNTTHTSTRNRTRRNMDSGRVKNKRPRTSGDRVSGDRGRELALSLLHMSTYAPRPGKHDIAPRGRLLLLQLL